MAYACADQVEVAEDQVIVAITHGLLGAHLGVAYQDSGGAPKLFHLAFHQTLLVEDYPLPEWLATRIPIDEFAGAQIVALLDGASKLYPNPKMPGSFDYGIALLTGQGSIAANGTYSPKDGCDGYTCSSIIAEIFRSFGFPLVALDTWPERDINRAWGQAIVCLLQAYGASPEHVQAVERNISGLRLRPEEVAAAAERFQPGNAAAFLEIEARADEVMAQVRAECAAPPPLPESNPMTLCVTTFQAAVTAATKNDVTAPGDAVDTARNAALAAVAAEAGPKKSSVKKLPGSRWRRLSPKRQSRRRKRH